MGLQHLALGEMNLVGEVGVLLELDPVPCLMVSHSMLQDHDLEHLLGFGVGEFTLRDKCSDRGV